MFFLLFLGMFESCLFKDISNERARKRVLGVPFQDTSKTEMVYYPRKYSLNSPINFEGNP